MNNLNSQINPLIFREYDIRGVVDTDLTVSTARLLGQCIGTFLRRKTDGNQLAVGRDNRLSSEHLKDALIEGLLASGCDVIDVGLSTSPLLYAAVFEWGLDGGINVTGSHNPIQYNGFKIVGRSAHPVGGTEMKEMFKLATSRQFERGAGALTKRDPKPRYFEKIESIIKLNRPMKVAVDTGNGVAGLLVPNLLRKLGCEVTEVHCDLDGAFPNHMPNPQDEVNVLDLKRVVVEKNAEIGFAFDGDGDRLGMIDENGTYLEADYILILLARDFLQRHPGQKVVIDVNLSKNVNDDIQKYGGIPVLWKIGHSLIKQKMRDDEILLGGEFSGHMFVFEDYYPIDDALFAALRILQMLSKTSIPLSQHFKNLPRLYSSRLIQLPIDDAIKHKTIRSLTKVFSQTYEINDVDGAKITFPDGWALIRASNTTPNLTLRFEADSIESLNRIKTVVYDVLKQFPAIHL